MRCTICQTETSSHYIEDICDNCHQKALAIGKSVLIKQVIEEMNDEQLMNGLSQCPLFQRRMYMSEMKKRGLR